MVRAVGRFTARAAVLAPPSQMHAAHRLADTRISTARRSRLFTLPPACGPLAKRAVHRPAPRAYLQYDADFEEKGGGWGDSGAATRSGAGT